MDADRSSGIPLEQAFLDQAPLMGLSSGRGTLVSADGVSHMKEGDSLVELPPSGHMEVAAASTMELRWMGRGSIELLGASAFEWSGSAFGQDEGDLFRMIQVSSADIEVRRGPLRLGLPGQVVLTIERGALEIESNPSGKYSVRLFGGESLRLTYPTVEGEGHVEIKPGKSMWIDPGILIGVAEARDMAAREELAAVDAKEQSERQASAAKQLNTAPSLDLTQPVGEIPVAGVALSTEAPHALLLSDDEAAGTEQAQEIGSMALVAPMEVSPVSGQGQAQIKDPVQAPIGEAADLEPESQSLADEPEPRGAWAPQAPFAAWPRHIAAPSLQTPAMELSPATATLAETDSAPLAVVEPVVEPVVAPAATLKSINEEQLELVLGSPSDHEPQQDPWSPFHPLANIDAELELGAEALQAEEQVAAPAAEASPMLPVPPDSAEVETQQDVVVEPAKLVVLSTPRLAPLAVYLPAAPKGRTARFFPSPIPAPWSPVPVAAAPKAQAPKGSEADLGLSDLINGLIEYEEIDW